MTDSARALAAAWVAKQGAPKALVYVAVFLDTMGRNRLLKAFPPEHGEVIAHHMTIYHTNDGGMPPDYATMPWGRNIPLKVIGHVSDDKAQAVVIQAPNGAKPVAQRQAHITISVGPGTKPVYSNSLIQAQWDGPVSGGIVVIGKLGWWDGTKAVFSPPGEP